MGYILPVQPFQAMQYAERINMKAYNYAHVNAVAKVKSNLILNESLICVLNLLKCN